jgi:hypothetical protein
MAGLTTVSNDEAALFGEIVVYSPRGAAPSEVLKDVSSLNEKVVIDLNNSAIPADFEFDPIDRSHAEKLQGQIPKARVVKAYNTFPQEVIELSPDKIRPYRVATFIAGDDQKARETVLALSRELGIGGHRLWSAEAGSASRRTGRFHSVSDNRRRKAQCKFFDCGRSGRGGAAPRGTATVKAEVGSQLLIPGVGA